VAGYKALAAVGRSIVDLLNRRFDEILPVAQPRPHAVLAGTVDFDQVNSNPVARIQYPAISVYCYRVSVDRETRPGWSAVASADGIPRLPLRMHLLVAAWDNVVESELESLGLTAQVLESVADDLALDSMSEAFQALTTDYRLSLPYVARVICLEGRREAGGEPVATMAAGGMVS
jgi:hypothetical protein